MDWFQLKHDVAKLSTITLIQNARQRVKAKRDAGIQLGLAAIIDELADRLEHARQKGFTWDSHKDQKQISSTERGAGR